MATCARFLSPWRIGRIRPIFYNGSMLTASQKISLIAAMGKNRELGFGNKLPWHLPDDLKRFKDLTRGHAVIMGRRTFESIGRPLPDRKNIIITRNSDFRAESCDTVGSMEEAIHVAGDDPEIFVIGGGEIYALGLPYANRMYLTFVDAEFPANAFFPEFDEAQWHVTSEVPHDQDPKHPYSFVFKTFEKREG